MKFPLPVSTILSALILMLPGCAKETPEPKHDAPQPINESAVLPGPIAPPGPIDPSTAVSLPPTTNPGMKPAETKPEETKPAEPKLEESKPAETKPEPPK